MSRNQAWVLVGGILLVGTLLALGIILVIRDTVQRTVSPVESMTGDLGTRVSEVGAPKFWDRRCRFSDSVPMRP